MKKIQVCGAVGHRPLGFRQSRWMRISGSYLSRLLIDEKTKNNKKHIVDNKCKGFVRRDVL